jgi:NarL family two-component system response regulator LiaR
MAIQVLLVDNSSASLAKLRERIDAQPDMEVVAEAGDGLSAIQLAGEMRPEVVVMGLLLPGKNAIEATREICRMWPEARVIILGKYPDRFIIDQLIEAGACRYVVNEAIDKDLTDAIRRAAAGPADVVS